MNRIVLIALAVVATSGCATANLDSRIARLLRENAQLRRTNASQGRELTYERGVNLDRAMGRGRAPTAQPQTAQVQVVGELGMVGPTPMQSPTMVTPGAGYTRVASAAYVATPPPWQGQTDAALEVPVDVSTQSVAIGITVNGTIVPIRYGDAVFPTTLQVAGSDGRLVPTPVVPADTEDTVRVLAPRAGQASLVITCYVVAAGTGQPFARWTRRVTVPGGPGISVFEHQCARHRIR